MTDNQVDVLVIGSGVGGLCCGALCARSGLEVLVLESHSQPGGAAHGFTRAGYHFESGPSLWSGLSHWPSINPLAQILKALDQELDVIQYKDWDILIPEGKLKVSVGNSDFENIVRDLRGHKTAAEWMHFCDILRPIAAAAEAVPLLALRPGTDVLLTQVLRHRRQLLSHLASMHYLTGAFGPLVNRHLSDPFLLHWVDMLCFLISGMPMKDTNAAAMATLFGQWFTPSAQLDYPRGGSASVVRALVKGLEKNGGELKLKSRVNKLLMEGDQVVGVILCSGERIRSKRVVSNTDMWSMSNLLPERVAQKWRRKIAETPACASFLHLHLGFDASGLSKLPSIHTVWVGDWERGVDAEQNMLVLSIPSVLDQSMAPEGHCVLHGYTPANEPWSIWSDIEIGSPDYEKRKEERCRLFWDVLEREIPDIRSRCKIVMQGTPLTHRRFLSVHNGSYGPALSAAKSLFPRVTTPLKNLWMCGASTFPGIGIPAVAASGALAAHGIVGRKAQSKLLSELDI
ncbi:NAD(P)/FAD-dependent oxidoreductase [cyanobiont of Ornithocercus magnificus]|nr:NAD(P)/FAD-dependent oxidoreductase [cyanobiont of Ornithocercus magnificus]